MVLSARRGVWLAPVMVLGWAAPAWASAWDGPIVLSRDQYAERLRGFWLGTAIANWTGIRTEGKRTAPPFLTDEDWGVIDLGRGVVDFVTDQDPWKADDDTDIEYVYLHLLTQTGVLEPDGSAIAGAWIAHVNRFIWVSNAEARRLMGLGVRPPGTGLGVANRHWLMIDAQLTTEMFGALAPTRPDVALRLADLPIRTTAGSHAAHAAQFHVALFALAAGADADAPPREQVEALVARARLYVPDSSKAADIVDFVRGMYEAAVDLDDWESARDAIYARYQRDAAANGFVYRNWFESSVNLATGVMALLYGQGDFRRTVQIATLSGWDSDNAAATMGGLIGLLRGESYIRGQFGGIALSERFWVSRTRDALPDHLPDDPAAEDTFSLMVERMLPVIDRAVVAGGGFVEPGLGVWIIPEVPGGGGTWHNPRWAEDARSVNNDVRRMGGRVRALCNLVSSPPAGRGVKQRGKMVDGVETDWSGVEPPKTRPAYFSSQREGGIEGDRHQITVQYDWPVHVHTVRLVEGDHFRDETSDGGWFASLALKVRVDGRWIDPPGGVVQSEALDDRSAFQVIDLVLGSPVWATGVRLVGPGGGADGFVTVAEIDVLTPPE